MLGCFPLVNDTSLDPRPIPSLHMRRHYSALSVQPRPQGLIVSNNAVIPRGHHPLNYVLYSMVNMVVHSLHNYLCKQPLYFRSNKNNSAFWIQRKITRLNVNIY